MVLIMMSNPVLPLVRVWEVWNRSLIIGHSPNFLAAYRVKHIEVVQSKDFQGHEAVDVALVGTVGCGGDGGVIKVEVLFGEEAWSVPDCRKEDV